MAETIYLIRKRALGDVLWVEPIIRQLSGRYSNIILYTKFPDLFENHPVKSLTIKTSLGLPEKLSWKLLRNISLGADYLELDMAYEHNPKVHLLHAYQEKAGLPLSREYPKLFLSPYENKGINKPTIPYIILHLESFTQRNYRNVYGIDWEAVVNYIKKRGFKTVLVGKSPELIPGAHHQKTDIREMISLIAGSSFFVGLDSGPSHIAASLQIPSIIFFGAVNPEYRHFLEQFQGYILQQPCQFSGCYHESFSISGPTCQVVGDAGIPPCSLHSTISVQTHIDMLISNFSQNV